MSIPSSVLLSQDERETLEVMWPDLAEKEKKAFEDMLRGEEVSLQKTILEITKNDGDFLKKFKKLRQKRKKEIFQGAEKDERSTTEKNLDDLILQL